MPISLSNLSASISAIGASNYLPSATAASTYAQSNVVAASLAAITASNYLTTATAASTYLTNAAAAVSISTSNVTATGIVNFLSNVTVGGNLLVTGSNASLSNYGYPVDGSANTGMVCAGNLGMFRNRIINGSFGINQRAIANATLAYTASATTYITDRFGYWFTAAIPGGSVTYSNVALTSADAPYQVAGLQNAALFTPASCTSTTFSGLAQAVEGLNVSDLAWGTAFAKPVTVSFWLKSGLAAGSKVSVAVTNYALAAGAVPTYNTTVTVTTQGAWQYATVTIPGPTVGTWASNTAGALWLMIGGYSSTVAPVGGVWNAATAYYTATGTTNWLNTTTGYIEIAGVQLEKGTLATPFEFRPYVIELELCQRYYENSFLAGTKPGAGISSNTLLMYTQQVAGQGSVNMGWVQFTVIKRIGTSTNMNLWNPYNSSAGVNTTLRVPNGTVDGNISQTAATCLGIAAIMTSLNPFYVHFEYSCEL